MNEKEIQVIDFSYLRMCAEHNYIYETGEAKLLLNYITNLQQENARLKDKIEKLNDYVEDRISALTVSIDNKAKDEYFNNKCIGGVQELKNVKVILKEN